MELTNLSSPISPHADKKSNLKRPNNSPVVSNSNTKVSPFMIGSRSPSPDGAQTIHNPKPNQVKKNIVISEKWLLKNIKRVSK